MIHQIQTNGAVRFRALCFWYSERVFPKLGTKIQFFNPHSFKPSYVTVISLNFSQLKENLLRNFSWTVVFVFEPLESAKNFTTIRR